jgi:hypothetical protein
MAKKASSPFSIRESTVGTGYLVAYLPPRGPQIQIRQTFDTEDEANKWVASEGDRWAGELEGQ